MRILWLLATIATLAFALAPAALGGTGGAAYHALAFLVLGGLTRLAFHRQGFFRCLLLLAAFGGAIEIAQFSLNTGRSAEWWDWFVDIAAGALGLVLGELAKFLTWRFTRPDG